MAGRFTNDQSSWTLWCVGVVLSILRVGVMADVHSHLRVLARHQEGTRGQDLLCLLLRV